MNNISQLSSDLEGPKDKHQDAMISPTELRTKIGAKDNKPSSACARVSALESGVVAKTQDIEQAEAKIVTLQQTHQQALVDLELLKFKFA
jgi:septal ring factor EnvC (AmiA/AmiB activator)